MFVLAVVTHLNFSKAMVSNILNVEPEKVIVLRIIRP